MSETGMEEAAALRDYWRQYTMGFLSQKQLFDHIENAMSTVDVEKVAPEASRVIGSLVTFFLGKMTPEEVDQYMGFAAPETPQDVAVMEPRDMERKKDQLLDAMNNWPPGSPQYQDALKQLKALGYSRFQMRLAGFSDKVKNDPFEKMLYAVFSGLGFQVWLATDGSVDFAEMEVGPGKTIRLVGDEHPDGAIYDVMMGNPEDPTGGDLQIAGTLVVTKSDSPQTVSKRLLGMIDRWLPAEGPEMTHEVPQMAPDEVNKRRDALLDKMNQFPEGSPEHEKAKEELQRFGSRFARKLKMAYDANWDMDRQADENVREMVKVINSKLGDIDEITYLNSSLGPVAVANQLVPQIWPEMPVSLPKPGTTDADWTVEEATEAFASWLSKAYRWQESAARK